MNPRLMVATASRVLHQIRHDRRTVALLLVVPCVLLGLLAWIYNQTPLFDRLGGPLLGIFPFLIMFLITSIAMLRERTTGTLERLLTTPLRKTDLLFGYGIAFGLAAALQASLACLVAYLFLGLDTKGSPGFVVLIAIGNAVLGVALGLLASAFAKTEFQAVQFMPVVVLPQILLCGLFVARASMVGWLQAISDYLPLTYSVEALEQVGKFTDPNGTMWRDLAIVLGCVVLALVLAASTLRRRTP